MSNKPFMNSKLGQKTTQEDSYMQNSQKYNSQ